MSIPAQSPDTPVRMRGASTFDTPLFLYYSAWVIEMKEKLSTKLIRAQNLC